MSEELNQRISNLNTAQRKAIESIMQGWDSPTGEFVFPIVEGPPGTGKTTVGIHAAALYKEETKKSKIAYLCYTNLAADRALEGLIEFGFSPEDVRRVVPRILGSSYKKGQLSKYYVAYDYINDLYDDDQRKLKDVPILITTLHSSGRIFRELLKRPLILIDEFSQVSPTLFFSTLSRVRDSKHNPSGYALLGDPNQLPVITTQPFLKPNIGLYIESKRKNYEPHELELQYRMHFHICQAVNALREALFTYQLKTDDSVRDRTLTRWYNWNEDICPDEFRHILDPNKPCVIINTDKLSISNEEIGFGQSKYYTEEATLAAKLAEAVYNSYVGKNGEHLLPTLLSPYWAQIGVIKNFLPPHLQNQCITIYQAQGREYPCVIVSFARKNPGRWIGFLGEPQLRAQTYVACSRAMAKLIVLFSFSTFRGHTDYDYLLEKSDKALIIDAEKSWLG